MPKYQLTEALVSSNYGPLKVTGNSIIQYSAYKFLLAFCSNYVRLELFMSYSEIRLDQ